MAHAAERGWVWCRRWHGAVRVVDCQCQTANLSAEAGHDLWAHRAGTDTEPLPELEFDQPAILALKGLSLKHIAADFACRPRYVL